MEYYAGMDIGGTFARLRIVTKEGTLLGSVRQTAVRLMSAVMKSPDRYIRQQ